MDAVKFIKEWNRMLKVEGRVPCIEICTTRTPEETVSSVDEWSAAHPRKTRQSVFLEQWPNCATNNDGVVGICPRNVDKKCICDLEHFHNCYSCRDCRRKFWMQEVE